MGKYVRYYSLPLKWKHTLGFSWAKGDWSHTLTQIYRDGYKDVDDEVTLLDALYYATVSASTTASA